MSTMHHEYYREVFRVEHEERLRAAKMARLAASVRTSTPLRRRCGDALIRFGLLVRGPVPMPTQMLVPAHRGGITR
jgi:hypothetical protein